MNENVNVCITPKGDKPVLHFSQFDNENVFTVTVLADDGESAAVLTGLDIEFRIRKTDSHVVTIAPESVADNVITFKTTEQMCACCGQNIATVTLMKDDLIISTLDILVDIQRDILSGGLTSESDIRNLTTQIEQIVPEVVGDDYYNKQEVDDLLAEHTFDPTNYYDKSNVDALLADKADSDDVYTKTETDDLLADKADSDDVYTKSEVDELLDYKADKSAIASLIVQKDVAKAPIASFNTDLDDDLTKCIVDINPVQAGTGTPSPSNPRTISGFTSANIARSGVNLVNISDKVQTGAGYLFSNYFISLPQGKYTLSFDSTANSGQCNFVVKKDNTSIASVTTNLTIGRVSLTVTITQQSTKIECYANRGGTFSNIQLEVGESASDFNTYNGTITNIPFGQTVYKGVLNVNSGKLNYNYAYVDLSTLGWAYNSGSECWEAQKLDMKSFPARSDDVMFEKYASDTTATTGDDGKGFVYSTVIYIASTDSVNTPTGGCLYHLASEQTLTLTPKQISAIIGDNNVYADTNGDIEVRFTETIGNELGV